jgi:hypothetical protein
MFKEVLPGYLPEGSPCRRETHEERRKQRRLKICRPVHIRLLNHSESATTLDIARQGLCFVTKRDHYHPGMSLFLTFLSSPYSSLSFEGKECVGDVVRVDPLPYGAWAVAVRFRP